MIALVTEHGNKVTSIVYNCFSTNEQWKMFIFSTRQIIIILITSMLDQYRELLQTMYSRVAYIYVRSRAKYLKFRTTTSKFNALRKPLMQQKYYFIHEM